MKQLALAALVVGIAALPLTGQAQAPGGPGAWYTATTYTVKPGMMPEFRQLITKELNPAAKKGGLAGSQVWRFSTGNTNRVLRIVLHSSLADRDGPSAAQRGMGDVAFAAYQKRQAALVESASTYIGRQRLDMGWNPDGSPAPKIAERNTIRVAPGRNADYMTFVRALVETFKKSGHRRTAGQIVYGGQQGTFVSNSYYDNWADLAKGRPPTRVLSGADLAAFNALNPPGLFTVVNSDVTIYDAEMSVVAATATSSK